MSLEANIDRLSGQIDEFRVEFEKFFAGSRATPPEDLRERIRAALRRLRSDPANQLAENFRIGALEARFNSFCELFNRRVREQEEGRPASRPSAPAHEADPLRGVVVSDAVGSDAARALYEALSRDPDTARRFDYDGFRRYLERQTAAIREKTGCAGVRFRLATEDGRLKLKAKPIAR